MVLLHKFHLPDLSWAWRPPLAPEWTPWIELGQDRADCTFSRHVGWTGNSHPTPRTSPHTQELVPLHSYLVWTGRHLGIGRLNILFCLPQRALDIRSWGSRAVSEWLMHTAQHICVQCWAEEGFLDNSGKIWASVNIQHEQTACCLPATWPGLSQGGGHPAASTPFPPAVPSRLDYYHVIPWGFSIARPLAYFILLGPDIPLQGKCD